MSIRDIYTYICMMYIYMYIYTYINMYIYIYMAASDLYLTPFSDLSWLVVLQPPNDDCQPLHNVSNLMRPC